MTFLRLVFVKSVKLKFDKNSARLPRQDCVSAVSSDLIDSVMATYTNNSTTLIADEAIE